MMHKIMNKHWNVLQINPELRETFQNNPFVALKKKITKNYRRSYD